MEKGISMLWIKFSLIILIVFILISIVKLLLRKLLNLKKVKEAFFSFYHINDLHRKVDQATRFFSTILILLSAILAYYYEDLIYLMLITAIISLVCHCIVKAFFEWKYTQYPKQSIITLTEMFLVLIAIVIVIEFQLLGPLL